MIIITLSTFLITNNVGLIVKLLNNSNLPRVSNGLNPLHDLAIKRQFSFETFVKSRKYEIQMINESSSTYYIDIYLEIIDKSVKEDIDSYLVNLFK